MLGDYAAPDRDFRGAVVQKFEALDQADKALAQQLNQQTIILTEVQGALKTITEALKEQKQEQRAAPANAREWVTTALAVVAALVALAGHISLH